MCQATRDLLMKMNDEYEQQLEAEAEYEGMVSCVDIPANNHEAWDEWVSEGDRVSLYKTQHKKDHSKFIQDVENNELSKDDIVKYLKENL